MDQIFWWCALNGYERLRLRRFAVNARCSFAGVADTAQVRCFDGKAQFFIIDYRFFFFVFFLYRRTLYALFVRSVVNKTLSCTAE